MMGSLEGHVLPGVLFFVLAVWWTIRAHMRYWKGNKKRIEFTSSVTFPLPCIGGRWKNLPVEGAVKIVFASMGIIAELTLYRGTLKMEDGQHVTMYVFFALSGITDILVYCKAPVPQNVDFIALAMAFGVEGLLFYFHLYGRTPLDTLVHTILVNVIVGCVVSVFLELKYRHSFLPVFGRCFFSLLQGTWLVQVGIILYSPGNKPSEQKPIWDEHAHSSLILAALVFAWHCATIFTLMLISSVITSRLYRNRKQYISTHVISSRGLLRHDSNELLINGVDDAEESDIELVKPLELPQ